ncbi:MAG: tetratricopeptide repeat protein [Acidobacteriota bacterium]
MRGRPLWGVPALRYVALALAVSCGGGSPSTPPGKVQGHRTKVAELADVVEPTLWRELTGLLKARDFAALDRRLGGFQEAYEADHLKEPEVLRAYGALASPDLALLPFYNEWVEKVPSSYSAHACRGLVESQLAWKRRGSAIAAKTTNEQWLGSAELAASSRADLMRAVELRPKLMPALKPLITLAMLGGPESPQEAYERAIAVDPDSYAARAAYIIALQPKWGGSLEAIQNVVDGMKEAEQHNPSLHSLHGSVAWARGGMMEWDNKPREALDQYQEAFRSGDCARFHEARGNVYKWLGIYRKAVPDFDSSHWTPADSDALANRGLCYYKLDLYDRAMRDLSLALEIDPTNADALKYRGYTSCKKRDWDAALKDYDLALQYEPTWSVPPRRQRRHPARGEARLQGSRRAAGTRPSRRRRELEHPEYLVPAREGALLPEGRACGGELQDLPLRSGPGRQSRASRIGSCVPRTRGSEPLRRHAAPTSK